MKTMNLTLYQVAQEMMVMGVVLVLVGLVRLWIYLEGKDEQDLLMDWIQM